jgi:SagB-type dehydrogenase family enzyme
MLWTEMGDLFRAQGRGPDAALAFSSSLRIAERSGDLAGVKRNRERLGQAAPDVATNTALPVPETPGMSILERTATDYAFDPNLLLDGPRTSRAAPPPAEASPVDDDTRPLLVPGTRTWLDPDGRIRFAPPADEPRVHTDGDCTVMRRTSREVAVRGDADLLWRLLAAMDGGTSWREIRGSLAQTDHVQAARLLGALAGAGVVDLSGRPLGRFIHRVTKKGVAPAGGLEGDEAIRLASAGEPRSPGELSRIPIATAIPERLRSFHELTRARRSSRDYRAGALSREELDALLATACGVTGSLVWPGGEVKLRAYPSSGALYSVGVYPVVFRVEGLEPAVHRFDAEGPALELVRSLDPAEFVRAALPMEREMLAGVAVMVCLTGCFLRHERKYGEGGYRMLVAEAGHISHNLVLAATALGLRARPFGGVFDGLVNRALGLDDAREQFLLAALVGR